MDPLLRVFLKGSFLELLISDSGRSSKQIPSLGCVFWTFGSGVPVGIWILGSGRSSKQTPSPGCREDLNRPARAAEGFHLKSLLWSFPLSSLFANLLLMVWKFGGPPPPRLRTSRGAPCCMYFVESQLERESQRDLGYGPSAASFGNKHHETLVAPPPARFGNTNTELWSHPPRGLVTPPHNFGNTHTQLW